MRYTFMNKNQKLFDFNYNENSKTIDEIVEIWNAKYLPLKLSYFENEKDLLDKFYHWLNNRYSKNSSWYKKVQWKYGSVNVDREFIIKSYGLSLSDQYWIKPTFSKEKWEDVNFFQNDFKYQPFLENDLKRVYDYQNVDVLYSPNITTGGELDKAWAILENGERVLYKSSNTFLGLEPINEYIASKICEILLLPHANCEIKILSNLNKKCLVSVCPTFITPNTELIHAEDLIDASLKSKEAFIEYVTKLDQLGIKNAKEKIQKMIFLDMVLSNSDRHKQNFGVIRNVETLEYVDIAPIYDTGRSMATDFPSLEQYTENFCLFNKQNATRKECLELMSGLSLTFSQIEKIKSIPNLYRETVTKYFEYTNLGAFKENTLPNLIHFLENNIKETLEYINEK